MKVAAYQAPFLPAGSMDAISMIGERVRQCEAQGVGILCCPEAILGGLADDAARPADFALSVGSGELLARLAPLASRAVTVIVGFTEAGEAGRLYNSAAVVSAGEIIGVYRKRHPARRRSIYSPGGESPVFTVGGFRFGIMICNDTNFPELGEDLADRGAQILFVPSNNGLRRERADVVAETRAVDLDHARRNGAAVVRADVAGDQGERIALGTSVIIDGRGEILRIGEPLKDDLLVADLDLPSSFP